MKLTFVCLIGLTFAFSHVQLRAEEKVAGSTGEPQMGIGGRNYPVSKVKEEYEKAKKRFAVDPATQKIEDAKKAKASWVTGKVLKQNAGQALVETEKGVIAVNFRIESATPTGESNGWMLKQRSARVNERMASGERVSLDQFDDMTLTASEFIQALKSGRAMGGAIKPAAGRFDNKSGQLNRMPSQWERRKIKVNK